ncbi:hypothetical protein MSAN_01924100 [Mycena sanguinolenta]|uniref:F-box domain-containing protein n=1 Tax=Mycena sanguinolenta TaxID=230812 RepID=A0A8H6XPL2_9AGAR|nr:hypothetical protein MSAN_01924100 [Mycena sanguinolenta]
MLYLHATTISQLPLELLQLIAKDIDHDPTLFSLRLVSKSLNFAVTPLVFRVVIVNDTLKSARAVSFLQECDESITSPVHQLVFRGGPEQDSRLLARRMAQEKERERTREALKTVFSRLTKFSELKSLRFDFHDHFEDAFEMPFEMPPAPSHYLLLQQAIFRAFAANSPISSLISLTLNNLLAIPDDICFNADFHHFFSPLQSLDISVLSKPTKRSEYFDELLAEFWKRSIPTIIRSAPDLSTLVLRSDQPVGKRPPIPFKDLSLPRLASLTLHNFALEPSDPDADVVVFIVRHNRTLTRLALHGCYIDKSLNGDFPYLWHSVFRLFEKELDILREFLFEGGTAQKGGMGKQTQSDFQRDPRFRYTMSHVAFGFLPWTDELASECYDLPALECLVAVVQARQG